MGAKDARELMRLREVGGISRLIEVFLRASLLRTESRASHYREDYPKRDDKNGLKWIFVNMKEGIPDFRLEPLPIEKYKCVPDRFYSDNFKF
jgi:succinate dehydrogenase/fumarate reductase flavoprotein subunit